MHLIDSHCHLDFEQFDLTREQILSRCKKIGVNDIVLPGVAAKHWARLIDICSTSSILHPALGLHPLFMDTHQSSDLLQLKKIIAEEHIIAIGEIGLDFYIEGHDKQAQIDLFTEQLKIAQLAQLPVLLHVRKAHDTVIKILKKHPVVGGIVHAFNGSLQQAEHYQKLGFVFGVGGAITYSRSTRLRTLFSQLSLSSIVLETDAPDMPLADMQTPTNSPENIPHILTALHSIRSESMQEIATMTTKNAKRILQI